MTDLLQFFLLGVCVTFALSVGAAVIVFHYAMKGAPEDNEQ